MQKASGVKPSVPENYEKERLGVKPNTVRRLDGKDIIEIVNVANGDSFTRKIKDITVWKEDIIISFEADREDVKVP